MFKTPTAPGCIRTFESGDQRTENNRNVATPGSDTIIRPMLGFKRLDMAVVTVRGFELAEKIKKDQFNIEKFGGRPATTPSIWAAILAA